MIRALRQAGITRTVLVTGDRADTAETVARLTGVDGFYAERDRPSTPDLVKNSGSESPLVTAHDL
jgi:high-affinity K+ transport system ATPase subunit B